MLLGSLFRRSRKLFLQSGLARQHHGFYHVSIGVGLSHAGEDVVRPDHGQALGNKLVDTPTTRYPSGDDGDGLQLRSDGLQPNGSPTFTKQQHGVQAHFEPNRVLDVNKHRRSAGQALVEYFHQ